jgi:hypothetical protein
MEISLATLATAASVAGSVVSTISQMQAASYQQAVAQRNQQIADENRQRAIEQSQIEQRDWGESAREQFGALMADLAASGVGTDGGSAALLRSGTRRLIGRDAERIREEGDSRARAFGQQSADFASSAQQAGRARTFNLFGGAIDATSTYISAATRNRRRNALLEAG